MSTYLEQQYGTKKKSNYGAGASEFLLALGQGISSAYGANNNLYTAYTQSADRRKEMEFEAMKYENALRQQEFENQLNTQKAIMDRDDKLQASVQKYAEMGMRPVDPTRAMSPGGRLPSRMITGAYGQAYVPSPAVADSMMNLYERKSDLMLNRQIARMENERKYRESEGSPMSADAAGRYAFADEALRNIPQLRQTMFPDGTPKSFRRDIATKMMTPWKYPNDKEVQNAKRQLLSVATGRGLIQSGTVVKDNEWSRLMQQMGIDVASAPESVFSSLAEQELFMNDFKGNMKPGTRKPGGAPAKPSKDSLGLF